MTGNIFHRNRRILYSSLEPTLLSVASSMEKDGLFHYNLYATRVINRAKVSSYIHRSSRWSLEIADF